jgi:hypothetical protein
MLSEYAEPWNPVPLFALPLVPPCRAFPPQF